MISMKTFYGLAGILLLISILGSSYNLYLLWSNMTLGAKVATIAGSILFQGLLVVLFLGMWKSTPTAIIEDSSLDNLVKEIQEKNVEQLKQRGKNGKGID